MIYICSVKHTKKVILSFLILFTFIGNIGFSVFTHSCEEDGIFRSYFVQSQNHCDEEKAIEQLPPCCQKEKLASCNKAEIEKDCCNDAVDVYKINLDYFSDYKVAVPSLICVENVNLFAFHFETVELSKYNPEHYVHPPPKLSGRDILIRNQVFRI